MLFDVATYIQLTINVIPTLYAGWVESMSFIKITNSIGPSIDPCGTPLITFYQSDSAPLMHTRCLQFVGLARNAMSGKFCDERPYQTLF